MDYSCTSVCGCLLSFHLLIGTREDSQMSQWFRSYHREFHKEETERDLLACLRLFSNSNFPKATCKLQKITKRVPIREMRYALTWECWALQPSGISMHICVLAIGERTIFFVSVFHSSCICFLYSLYICTPQIILHTFMLKTGYVMVNIKTLVPYLGLISQLQTLYHNSFNH